MCTLDSKTRDHIVNNDGVELIVEHCLTSKNENTLLSGLTTIIFLITPETKQSGYLDKS